MITPRSERAVWPTLNSDLNALDYPMTFTGMGMGSAPLGWLGEGMSPFGVGSGTGNMNAGSEGDVGMGGALTGSEKNHELDFFSF